MRILWPAAALVAIFAIVAMAGCSSTDHASYRAEPRAFGNPALLSCAANQVPVCDVQGGRTRKYYSNCSCR